MARVKARQVPENLTATRASMRARSYHASPGELISRWLCTKLVDELCEIPLNGGAFREDAPGQAVAALPPVTSINAAVPMGCRKIRKRDCVQICDRIVIHT